MDSEIANPEMPVALSSIDIGDASAVPGTLYTKAWLLDMLVRLVKVLEGDRQQYDDVAENEEELDTLFSKFWDVTTEAPVGCFLAENNVMDVLLPACLNADASQCNRQVEISLGILANVVSISETKQANDIAVNEYYRQAIIGLFSKYLNDADVLVQCCRLLNACFHCSPDVFSSWEDALLDLNLLTDEIEADDNSGEFSLPDCFLFILRSSKNEQLLLEVAKLLELLSGNVGRFLYEFAASPALVQSVAEASHELGWSADSETVCRLIDVLYMVTTVDAFRSELASLIATHKDDVISSKLVNFVVKQFPHDSEIFELDDISCALASSFSLLLTLLTIVPLSNFPLLFQRDDLWAKVKQTFKLLGNHRFSAEDERSPAAVLKLNVVEFVETTKVKPDVNVEQYVLNKIL